jgi:hypothetical protein
MSFPQCREQLDAGHACLGTQCLRPLVNAGVIAYARPDQPNHPHQAYRAVDGKGVT